MTYVDLVLKFAGVHLYVCCAGDSSPSLGTGFWTFGSDVTFGNEYDVDGWSACHDTEV